MKTKQLVAIIAAVVVVVAVVLAVVFWPKQSQVAGNDSDATPTQAPTQAAEPTEAAGKSQGDTPLVVGYSPFSEKFSPFFAQTAYDQDVVSLTQASLLTTDRTGGIVYNGIEGETISYNGVDYYYNGIADV